MPEKIGKIIETREELEVEWRIPDFISMLQEVDDYSHKNSPAFYFCGSSWYLRLYPNGHSEYNTIGWIGIFLVRGTCGPPVTLAYTLGLKTADGTKVTDRHKTDVFGEKDFGYGLPRLFLGSQLMKRKCELAPSGVFTIICSLKVDDSKDIGIAVKCPSIICVENQWMLPKLVTKLSQLVATFSKYLSKKDFNHFRSRLLQILPFSRSFIGQLIHSENSKTKTCLYSSEIHPTSATVGEVIGTQREAEVDWKIGNFFSLSERVNVCYCSPTFDFSGSSWYLKIYPNGHSEKQKTNGCIVIYLIRGNSGPPVTLTHALGMKTADGEKPRDDDHTTVYEEKDFMYGPRRFLTRSKLIESKSEDVPSDVLTVIAFLREDDPKVSEIGAKQLENIEVNHNVADEKQEDLTAERTKQLLWDLKGLMHRGDYSDMIVDVNGEKFPLHKSILEIRAPTFLSMLQHEMEEITTGIVFIDDCEEHIFRTFLLYLYTGTIEEDLSPEHLIALYKMADKFQVGELKSGSFERLKNTSVDMSFDIKTLEQTHDENELMEQA